MNKGSSAGIVTRLMIGIRGIMIWFPTGTRNLPLFQNGPDRLLSQLLSEEVFIREVKLELRTSTPPWAFMVCSGKML